MHFILGIGADAQIRHFHLIFPNSSLLFKPECALNNFKLVMVKGRFSVDLTLIHNIQRKMRLQRVLHTKLPFAIANIIQATVQLR
jgi:hypothetical protein